MQVTSSLSKILSSFVVRSLSKCPYLRHLPFQDTGGSPRDSSGANFEIRIRPSRDISPHIWSNPFKFAKINQPYHELVLLCGGYLRGKHGSNRAVYGKESSGKHIRSKSTSRPQRFAFRGNSRYQIVIFASQTYIPV